MITHKAQTRWDKEGESFHAIAIVSDCDMQDIKEEFRFRCGCDHDCCGHVSSFISGVRPLSGDRFAVRTYGYRNI
jgi:hypothetical protein